MNTRTGIIIPCFNEEQTVIAFLSQLRSTVKSIDEMEVMVVNDGSTDQTLSFLTDYKKNSFPNLRILDLRYNVGHQKAIYQGMHYAMQLDCAHFIIMDGDGEDDPTVINELLLKKDKDVVHVKRGKRSENWRFRFFYTFYLLVFRFITGQKLNYGNYCMINRKAAQCVLDNSFIHLAAFISKQKFNTAYITSDRKKRIDGSSKMNFTRLVQHGLNAFIEYADRVVFVFLKLALILIGISVFSIAYIAYEKLFTDKAILGWASTLSIGFLNAAVVCLGFFVCGLLLIHIAQKNTVHSSALYSETN